VTRRRIVPGMLGVVAVATVLVAGGLGLFHGRLAADTLPANRAQAEDVAYGVAADAGCGQFDSDLYPATDEHWWFGCHIGDVFYAILVFGSDGAQAEGIAWLESEGRPYLARFHYAVTAPRQDPDKAVAMAATPPPESILDPFR
jgi:hypothetical protein